MLVEEAGDIVDMLQANFKKVHIGYRASEYRFFSVIRNKAKGPTSHLHPVICGPNGDTFVSIAVELPHHVAFIVGAVPTTDLCQFQAMERPFSVIHCFVSGIDREPWWHV